MSDNDVQQKILDGRLWAEFCDNLKQAGDIVMGSTTPDDSFNRAEGFRYLTRLLRAGLESNVEFSDPRFPEFFSLADETKKIGNDNPDNFYQNVNIDGRYDYRITGQRGSVHYLSLGTKAGNYATTGTMEPTGQLESDQLDINPDGSFEIIVSARQQPGNWLPMREDSNNMVIRQTFNDRKVEIAADLNIECLNSEGNNFLQEEAFASNLQRSVNFVKGTAQLFVDWMGIYSQHINQLPSDDQQRCQRAGGDAAIHYLQSYWKLAADEALIIHAKEIPDCKTWNFQLSNYWMESLDYRYYTVSVNKHSAVYADDGSVTVVVAHQNPGDKYPNWLHTTGHDQGGMLWRWVEARDDNHPPLECRVVKFSQL